MAHASTLLRWVLTVMVGVLSGMFFLELRSARSDRQHQSSEFLQALRQFEQKVELGKSRTAALLTALQRLENDLRQLVTTRHEISNSPPLPVPDPPGVAQTPGDPKDADLPPLPADVQPLGIITDLKPAQIAEDPRFNPAGRNVRPTEMFKIDAALTRGRAMIQSIDSEVRAQTMGAMDVLRSEGAFLEYAPGEEYQKVEGVLTAAEPGEQNGHIRMFYLQPERFPKIYQLKNARVKEAELALRKAIAVIDEQDQEAPK